MKHSQAHVPHMIFGSRGGPDEAPNGVEIASKVNIEMEFYKNRLGECSERARRAKKSSPKQVWEHLGRI